MANRKWIETEQQPDTAEPGNMLGCCLNYFHFLWAILSTSTVEECFLILLRVLVISHKTFPLSRY